MGHSHDMRYQHSDFNQRSKSYKRILPKWVHLQYPAQGVSCSCNFIDILVCDICCGVPTIELAQKWDIKSEKAVCDCPHNTLTTNYILDIIDKTLDTTQD